jgi:hypothetical protein
MKQDLCVADNSYHESCLPWNAAYKHSLISFVIDALLGMQAQWGWLNGRHLFPEIFLKK